jgi:hypothetical protein
MRFVILLCGVLSIAHAENGCPWMNAATAAGLLGGDVSARFVSDNKQGGKCEFTRVSNSAAVLRIEIAVMESPKTQFAGYLAKCSAADPKPLKAIGNEAFACGSDREQRVIGRVRNQAFVVTLAPADTASPDTTREDVKKAADIIAGNLF